MPLIMALPFEFALEGPPVSQQTRRRALVRQWTQSVRNAAEQHWDGSLPVTGPVMVSIFYIFDRGAFDVDNIPKPVLDALKGLVYLDDTQITDLICRKRPWNGVLHTATPPSVFNEFLRDHNEFVYVRVSDAPSSGEPL